MAGKLSEMKERSLLKKIIYGVIAVLLVLVAVKMVRLGIAAYGLYGDYRWAKEIMADPGSLDMALVRPKIGRVNAHLSSLQEELGPFAGLLRRLNWVPRVGEELSAAPALLGLATSMSRAGEVMLADFDPLLQKMADPQNPIGGQALLTEAVTILAHSPDDVELARRSFDEALRYRAKIDAGVLSPRIAKLINRFDAATPWMKLGFQFAPVIPTLTGADQPRTYLIIAQNNDELRATGGFISAVGTLTLDHGQIAGLKFEDSYAVDDFTKSYPDAPDPLERYMLAYVWVFRDANWSPDFPTSARKMVELYQISRNVPIDGVIAVDQLALQDIVGALEPVMVAGWDEPVTKKNVIDLIRQSWSPDEDFTGWDAEWWKNRKGFVSDLASAIRKRVEESPREVEWAKFGQTLLGTLEQRRAQIWLANPEAQALIQQQGWAGAIRQTEADYLFVVDTNMGFNKVNAIAQTSLRYQVDLTDLNKIQADLAVTHQNPSKKGPELCDPTPHYGPDYWEITNRCYWDYLRIYVLSGANLLRATPHPIAGEFLLTQQDEPAQVTVLPNEGGKSVWGTLLLVPRGESLETSFSYTLPAGVVQKTESGRRYRLLVQKQAGTAGNRGQVVVQLPPGSRGIQVLPAPTSAEGNRYVFDFTLDVDQQVEINFEPEQ